MEKNSRRIPGLGLAIATSALLVFGGSLAVADEVSAPAETLAEQNAAAEGDEGTLSVAGMTVFIDKETGQYRLPTAEEAAILSEAVSRLFAPTAETTRTLQQVATADGTVGVRLDLSQLAFSVATVGADGGVEHECARTAEDALAHAHTHDASEEDR